MISKPINPLEGIRNSKCCKSPFGSIISNSPFLLVANSIHFPEYSLGTSITSVSKGSCFIPFISFSITFGFQHVIHNLPFSLFRLK